MRATAVLRYLVEHGGVPADRISATGYGAEHPIVANDSAADRARNRRVDIVILSAASMQQLSSQAATASGTTSP
jgi:chemotaxis protein MotB